MGAAAAASLFIPGPEDVVIGAAAGRFLGRVGARLLGRAAGKADEAASVGKRVDSVLEGAEAGKKGKTKQFHKSGDAGDANKDFDSLAGDAKVTDHGDGLRSAELEDGTTISVRSSSGKDGSSPPTLQINPTEGKAVKVRYEPKE